MASTAKGRIKGDPVCRIRRSRGGTYGNDKSYERRRDKGNTINREYEGRKT